MQQLTFTSLVALFGWIPIVVFLFVIIPIRRALLATMVLGFLFLPQAYIEMRGGLPDYTRYTAMAAGAFLALLILDFSRLAQYRPSWVDLPAIIWCFIGIASSVSNGLGFYDGISATITRMLGFGLFYLYGRIYLADVEGLRLLLMALFLGALVYVPLCLFEVRMSPQLHNIVYGFHQHDFSQTMRLGGWRPMVFMQHGLALGMFLCTTTLLGIVLWQGGYLARFGGFELLCLGGLLVTLVLCRSSLALLLFAGGVGVMLATRWLRSPWPLLLLTLVPIGYSTARLTGVWDGRELVDMAATYVNVDRAQSLEFRLDNEDLLIDKALERPVLGWAGWGRSRVIVNGRVTITDGYWILALGRNGLVGLLGLTLMHLLPAWLLIAWVPARQWFEPDALLVFGCALFLALYMVDNLLNAMNTPFTMLAAGATLGLLGNLRRQHAVSAEAPLPILSTKELLGLATADLPAYARIRWGEGEFVRREQELELALAALDPDDWREWRLFSELFERLLFSLRRAQVERFLRLPIDQKKQLALFLTGQGERPPQIAT